MRLLHVIHAIDLSQGGVVRSVLDLTSGLALRGHDVRIFTQNNLDGDRAFESDTGHGEPVARPEIMEAPGPSRSFRRLGSQGSELAAQLTRWADAVHVHAVWHPMHSDIVRLANESGCGRVLSTHGMLDSYTMAMKPMKKRLFLWKWGRAVIESMNVVHCTSPVELDESRRWFGAARDLGRVIPLAIDPAPLERSTAAPRLVRDEFGLGDDPVILFLGRIHPIKGLPLLLRAFGRLDTDRVRPRLVLAGDLETPSEVQLLQREARRLGVHDRVHLVGVVGGERKVSLLRAASVLVLPSHHENFGMVIPEALVCGAPVVVTKGVGIWPEIVERGVGVAVERDADQLAQTLHELLLDRDKARAMADAGAEWVRHSLSGDAVMNQYERMYRDAAGAGRPHA
jgi:glycosyltransferase involved in cell wall biosynthesis